MKKSAFWIVLLALLLAAAGMLGYSVLSQIGEDMDDAMRERAQNALPLEQDLLVYFVEGGASRISWTGAARADGYRVEVLDDERHGRQIVFKEETAATECELPVMPYDREFTVRINSFVRYNVGEEENIRYGDQALERQVQFRIPGIRDLEPVPNPANRTLHVAFSLDNADACVISHDTGDGYSEKSRIQKTDFTIQFGDGGYPMPAPDETFVLVFEAEHSDTDGRVRLYGYSNVRVELTRDDLMDGSIELSMSNQGNNTYRLTWNEGKGDTYSVQMLNNRVWETVYTSAWDRERSYTTPRLPARGSYIYRVIGISGPAEECVAVSGEITITTSESPVYCTVWPNRALTVFKDALLSQSMGVQAAAGRAYCVLAEEGGAFRIRVGDDAYGYVDSRYCLINLQEYLGSMCAYDIVNSYESLYMVHEYEIPGITGKVIAGYENVLQKDGDRKSFLVPQLYPTAKKIAAAARKAESMGYRLKLYDTFRPNTTTLNLYSAAEVILNSRIPDRTFYNDEYTAGLQLPPPRYHSDGAAPADPAAPTAVPEAYLTYSDVMLNDRYSLNYFLARGYSKHNYGIALDLTIEGANNGKEVRMQTRMHDLSSYAARDRNGANANTLSDIMTSCGFETLVSEWWHYNDMESYNALGPSVMSNGVNGECWMADETGWRYRRAGGEYYRSCEAQIDGKQYKFDDRGYVIGQ